ncbi:MAG: phospholipase D-like domain-containing protein [Kiritimatiellia bacterium]
MQGLTPALLAVFALCAFVPQAEAGQIWEGDKDNAWTTAKNWDSNVLPTYGSGQSLYFGAATSYTPNNDNAAWGISIGSIFFNSGANSYTISGNSFDVYTKIENNDDSLQTFGITIASAGTTLELNPVAGDLTLSGTIYNNGDEIHVWGDNSHKLTLSGDLNGTGKLILKQYSIVEITGTSTYTGNTEIDEGEFWIGAGGSVGGGTVYVGNGGSTANTAKMYLSDMDGGLTCNEPIIVNSGNSAELRVIGGINTSGINTYSGTLSLANDEAAVEAASGGTVVFSGVISGGNNLVKNAAGTVSLSAENTFSGALYINNGTLEVSNTTDPLDVSGIYLGLDSGTDSPTLQIGADNVTIDNSVTVRSGSSGIKYIKAPYSGTISGAVTLNETTAGRFMVDVAASETLTISGNISGSGYLVKTNTGTLVLSGDDSYTGATTVGAGTLVVDNWCDDSAFTVGAPATLMGDSAVDSLTVNGKVDPGTSADARATLSCDGALTLNGGGSMQVDISNVSGTPGTDWDLINASAGAVTAPASGTFTIYLNDVGSIGFSSVSAYSWKIVDGSSMSGYAVSDFTVNTAAFSPSLDGGSFSVTNSGGDLFVSFSPPVLEPEISVRGTNMAEIADGDDIVSVDDGTTFESLSAGSTHDHIFTITNAGSGTLTLSGQPTITGSSVFTLQSNVADLTLAAGQDETFTIRFTPNDAGVTYTGMVTITSDDSDEATYTFSISGSSPCFTDVTGMYVNPTNNTSFTLNWTDVPGADGYLVDVLTNMGGGSSGSGLLISQYTETSAGTVPKGIELWNAGSTTIDFSSTGLDILVGVNGAALSSVYTLNSGTLAAGAVMVVGTTDLVSWVNANYPSVLTGDEPFTYNGDDALQVKLGGVVQDTFGNPGSDPGTGWAGSGVQTYNQNISLLDGINTGDTDGWTDPSTRFEIAYNNPVWGTGYDGFGVAPAGGGSSAPSYVSGYSNRWDAGTPLVVTGLTAEMTYYYRITATNESCSVESSVTGTVTTVAAPASDTTGPTISNFGVTNKTGTTVLDYTFLAGFPVYVDIADSTSGIDWVTSPPTFAMTNPAGTGVGGTIGFTTTGHADGQAACTATGAFPSAQSISLGTWTASVRAVDQGGFSTVSSFAFTVADDDSAAPSLGASSDDWGVYWNHPDQTFNSECPGEYDVRDQLIARVDLLDNGHTGTLSTYTFSGQGTTHGFCEPLLDAVSNALNRGASVRLIIDDGVNTAEVFGNNSIDSLESGSGLVVSQEADATRIMHDKLGLFDYGAGNRWVLCMSGNFTMAAGFGQWNIATDIRNDDLYAAYNAEAEELLAGRFAADAAKSHAHDGSTFTMQGSWGANWVRFAPYPESATGGDNALTDITNAIGQADGEIYFALNQMTRRAVSDALIAACDRGVIVHGAIAQEAYSGTDWSTEYTYLTTPGNYAGTNVVHFHSIYEDYCGLVADDGSEYDLIHAKWMVVDPFGAEPMVIHGSANWTATALEYTDGNDENVEFLRHAGIAAKFFEEWTEMTGLFTGQVQAVDSGLAMHVLAGTALATLAGGSTTNAVWQIDDANLLTNTLSLVFNVYDDPSGINRGVNSSATNMHVSVANLCTNNVTNFVAALSSADTTVSTSTSVWKFVDLSGFVDNMIGTNAVYVTVYDADSDRDGDSSTLSYQLVGYIYVAPSCPTAPTVLYSNPTNATDFTAHWSASTYADGYLLDVSTNPSFTGGSGGGLIISKVCDPTNGEGSNSFVQIYNTSGSSIDLTGWSIVTVENGADAETINLSGSIASGDSMAIGDNLSTVAASLDFTGDYFQAADSFNGGVDDGAKLYDGATLVDVAVGLAFADKALVRTSSVQNATNVFTSTEWSAVSVTDVSNTGGGAGDVTAFTSDYPSGAGGGAVPGYDDRPVSGTSVVVTGLTESITYYFRVKATNDYCESDWSVVTQVVTVVGQDAIGPTFSNFAVTNSGGATVWDHDFGGFPLFVDISDSTTGVRWTTAQQPFFTVTNPSNSEIVGPTNFLTDGHADRETLCTATGMVPNIASSFVAGTWSVSVWAEDMNNYAGTNAFTFTAADDDTTPPTVQYLCLSSVDGSATVSVANLLSASGWWLTGRVNDADSGIDTNGFLPYFLLYDYDGTIRYSNTLKCGFADGGATSGGPVSNSSLTALSSAGAGVWTAKIFIADNDTDGWTGDSLVVTGECAFAVFVGCPVAPTELYANPTNVQDFTANWTAASGATGYLLQVSTNSAFGAGGGTEPFTDMPDLSGISTYLTRGWTNNGVIWKANQSRTDQTINGSKALCFSDAADGYLISTNINGGIGSITFTHQMIFTGLGGNLEVYVNGALKGTVAFDATIQTATVSGINASGICTLMISNDASEQVAIDNLTWTEYGSSATSFVDGYSNRVVSGTSQSVTGLVPNTTYYYRLASTSEGCTSEFSSAASVITRPVSDPSAASATADRNTLIDLAWTKHASYDVMIVHKIGSASTAPEQGTAYSVGGACGGGTVIYKGSDAALEHVVCSDAAHYYAFYSYIGNYYSTGLTASASTGAFDTNEIVDTFSYTTGVNIASVTIGSNGWNGVWSGDTSDFSVSSGSFASQMTYPLPAGNKVLVSPAVGTSKGIGRTVARSKFTNVVYAGYIMNFQYGGDSAGNEKWSGAYLMEDGTNRVYFGEVGGADQKLGVHPAGGSHAGAETLTAGTGNDYIIIIKYDIANDNAYVSAFKIGTDEVPYNEPSSWDAEYTNVNASGDGWWINGIRLEAGGNGTATPGDTYFDEVRFSPTWPAMVELMPGFIYDWFEGTVGNSLSNWYGGTGWSNLWTLGGATFVNFDAGSMDANNSSYHTNAGEKIVMYGDVDDRDINADRAFATNFTSGQVYFSWLQNYEFNGSGKWAGLSLMDESTEKAFVGKVGSADKALGIDSDVDATSAVNLEPGTGNDYVIVARYDFSTRELCATSYKFSGTVTNGEMVAEEPNGYWQVTTTQTVGHITNITGVRFNVGANAALQIGDVYMDEVRVGTNWFEVTRRDGEAQAVAMAAGPVPTLIYVGTDSFNNVKATLSGTIADITVTDEDLANTTAPLSIAARWEDPNGVFLTNSTASITNIGSRAGRVNPNWDPAVLEGTEFSAIGYDALFASFYGYNGASVVTSYVDFAFNITNDFSTATSVYYMTMSAEDNNMGGGTIPAPNSGDAVPAWRAITVNTNVRFFVSDDDTAAPTVAGIVVHSVAGVGTVEVTDVESGGFAWCITGLVYDADSGINVNGSSVTMPDISPYVVIYDSAGQERFTNVLNCAFTDGGATAAANGSVSNSSLAAVTSPPMGIWSAVVFVADNDFDRTGDALYTSNSCTFVVKDCPVAPTDVYVNPTNWFDFTLNWTTQTWAEGYRVDVSTNNFVDSGVTTNLYESFVNFTTAGGTIDIASQLDTYTLVAGWDGARVYEDAGQAKLGSSTEAGIINTPVLDLSAAGGIATLKFDAYSWSGDNSAVIISMRNDEGPQWDYIIATQQLTEVMTTYEIQITGCNATTEINIESKNATSERFYLDNVYVLQGGISYVTGYYNRPASGSSLSVTGLNELTTYYYRIAATNSWCDAAYSITGTVTTVAQPDPPKMTNFGINALGDTSATDGELAGGFDVLSWITDTNGGLDWVTAPTFAITNPSGTAAVSGSFLQGSYTQGVTSVIGTGTVAAGGIAYANMALGTWTAGLWAQDTNHYYRTTNYSFTVTDDDTTGPTVSDLCIGGSSGTGGSASTCSVSTLSAGDIFVTGFNADGTDDFSFVSFTDIDPSVVIYFTDMGWSNGTWSGTGEGAITYTTPASGLQAGERVVVRGATVAGVTATTGSVVRSGAFDFAAAGDQILVYQAGAGFTNFVFALSTDSTTWSNSPTAGNNNSWVPPGLTPGVDAMHANEDLGMLADIDCGLYTGIVSGTEAELKTALFTGSNWTSTDTGPLAQSETAFTVTDYCLAGSTVGTITDHQVRYGGYGVTVTVADAQSGVLSSNAASSYYLLYNTNGTMISSNLFLTPFTNGYPSATLTTTGGPSVSADVVTLGTCTGFAYGVDADNDRPGDYASGVSDATTFIVIDDDTNPPSSSGFQIDGAGAFWDSMTGTLTLTGIVSDASGVDTDSMYYLMVTNASPFDGVIWSNSFTATQIGSTTNWAVTSTSAGPAIEGCGGEFLIRVFAVDGDLDRGTVDTLSSTNASLVVTVIGSSTNASDYAQATNLVVDGQQLITSSSLTMTDADINTGGYDLSMAITHNDGIYTNSGSPSFTIVNSMGTIIDQPFSNITIVAGTPDYYYATNYSLPAVAAANVATGWYSVYWSASNQGYCVASLQNRGDVGGTNVFLVNDDDSAAPSASMYVMGQAYAVCTVEVADADAGFSFTGLIQDVTSGIDITFNPPVFDIYNESGTLIYDDQPFTTQPTHGGAMVSAEPLAVTITNLAGATCGNIYTVRVMVVDNDGDRTGDSLVTQSVFAIQVAGAGDPPDATNLYVDGFAVTAPAAATVYDGDFAAGSWTMSMVVSDTNLITTGPDAPTYLVKNPANADMYGGAQYWSNATKEADSVSVSNPGMPSGGASFSLGTYKAYWSGKTEGLCYGAAVNTYDFGAGYTNVFTVADDDTVMPVVYDNFSVAGGTATGGVGFLGCDDTRTNLVAGDIAIIGMNTMTQGSPITNQQDSFAFVVTVGIPAGTVIHFTDNGWRCTEGLNTTEGYITWTSTECLEPGTVVIIKKWADPTDSTSGISANYGTVVDPYGATSGFLVNRAREQILAYQGSATSPTFLYCLNSASGVPGTWSNCPPPSTDKSYWTALPPGLQDGLTAVSVENFDDVVLSTNVLSIDGDRQAVLEYIGDYSNWIGHDEIVYPLNTWAFVFPSLGSVGGTISDEDVLLGHWDITGQVWDVHSGLSNDTVWYTAYNTNLVKFIDTAYFTNDWAVPLTYTQNLNVTTVQPADSYTNVTLGTGNFVRIWARDIDADRINDGLATNRNVYFTVVDDDINPPFFDSLTWNGLTYLSTGVTAVAVTARVNDIESGIAFVSAPPYILVLAADGTVEFSNTFSVGSFVDGDAENSPTEITAALDLSTLACGTFTAKVVMADADLDRLGDRLMVTNMVTLDMAGSGTTTPATGVVTAAGVELEAVAGEITDGMINTGGWDMAAALYHASGIAASPTYQVFSAATNELFSGVWSNYTTVGTDFYGTNPVSAITDAGVISMIDTGFYPVVWYARSDNECDLTGAFDTNLMLVVDDDIYPPTNWVTPVISVTYDGAWTNVNDFTATWSASSDDSGFSFMRVINTNPVDSLTMGLDLGTNNTLHITDAVEGQTTNWIYAVDYDSDRPSDQLRTPNTNFVIRLDMHAPGQPTVSSVGPGTDASSEIKLIWEALPDGGGLGGDPLSPWESYRVYYETETATVTTNSPYFDHVEYGELGTNITTQVTISNLAFGSTYNMALGAIDEAGNIGPLSGVWQVNTLAFNLTQAVTRVGSTLLTNSAFLSWTVALDELSDPMPRAVDLIYVDAASFTDSLTNLWALQQTVYDADANTIVSNLNIQAGMTRFFRAAIGTSWTTNRTPRAASKEVWGLRPVNLYPGQNWVSLFGRPYTNTVIDLIGNHLPAGSSASSPDATKISWYARAVGTAPNWWVPTQQVALVSGTPAYWEKTLGGTTLSGNSIPIPLNDAFVVEIPTSSVMQTIYLVGRVPTNTEYQTIQGGAARNLISMNLPYAMHPSQMGLTNSGSLFVGGLFPPQSCQLWKYDRANQRAPYAVWLRSSDKTWRLTSAGFPLVPAGYFSSDDGIYLFTTNAASSFVVAPPLPYTEPTTRMTP